MTGWDPSAPTLRTRLGATLVTLTFIGLAACAPAASDDDGEVFAPGPMAAAAPKQRQPKSISSKEEVGIGSGGEREP